MYSIHQFRPTLYLLLLLGITGFCFAASAPGLWLISAGLVLGHWLIRSRGVPTTIPAWLAAIVALVFGLLAMNRFLNDPGNQLLTAGQFLVLLQLVKLFQEGPPNNPDQRAENRNYAWLMVLSLLLMVAAAISTASLVFGIMFLSYIFLSLYSFLLYHLKIETENAKIAMTIPKDAISPAQLRQTEKSLPKSMRRLTALVASAGLVLAVIVFVFFPRGPGQGLFGQLNFRPAQALTGFSEQISFESVARITTSTELVARAEWSINGQPVPGTRPLYLRGVTLDTWTGDGDASTGFFRDSKASPKWVWTHTAREEGQPTKTPTVNEPDEFAEGGATQVVTDIKLEPTGRNFLFLPAGAHTITFNRDVKYQFFPSDETIQLGEPITQKLDYKVVSRDAVGYRQRPADLRSPIALHATAPSRIAPEIIEYAHRPDVSGVDSDGTPLWKKRGVAYIPNALDEKIASNIEQHLLTQFSYTLDLTDTKRSPDVDPIVWFLTDTKRGHCEYFAGAMALLCQSLGIEARVVTGFKCDEYNPMIGRYIVRQSHAHAWVEVRVAPGENWRSFDPTTGREYRPVLSQSLVSKAKRFVDYLEYTWADSVVAYDRDRRENLLSSVDKVLTSSAARTQSNISDWDNFLPDPRTWNVSPIVVGSVMIFIGLAGVSALAYFAWERWRMKQRAKRIGLSDIPDAEKIRLARQLGFYDDLLRLLALRGIERPKHQTPFEFTHNLTHLPAETYNTIQRLTRIYYRIRYGQSELAPTYHRRIKETLARLEPSLGEPKLP